MLSTRLELINQLKSTGQILFFILTKMNVTAICVEFVNIKVFIS